MEGDTMSEFLPYLYTAMWFIIGIGLFYVGKKNHFGMTTVVCGSMFVFLGFWWLINTLTPETDMLEGTYGWIFRIVIASFVLVTGFFYLQFKKNNK